MKTIYNPLITLTFSFILSANLFFATAMEETELAVNMIKRKELGSAPEEVKNACSVSHLEDRIAPVAAHLLFLKQVVGEALGHIKIDYSKDYNQKREELFPGWDNDELTDFLFWAYKPIFMGIDNSYFTDKRPGSFKEKLNEIREDPLKHQAVREILKNYKYIQERINIPVKKVRELEKIYHVIDEAFVFYNNLATLTYNVLVDTYHGSFGSLNRVNPMYTVRDMLETSSKLSCKYLLSSLSKGIVGMDPPSILDEKIRERDARNRTEAEETKLFLKYYGNPCLLEKLMLARDRYKSSPAKFARLVLKELYQSGDPLVSGTRYKTLKSVLKECQVLTEVLTTDENPFSLEYERIKMAELREVENSLVSTITNLYEVKKNIVSKK